MASLFHHARFQAPIATTRSVVSAVWRGVFAAIGRYAPLTKAEQRWSQGDSVVFSGDIPLRAGRFRHQRRLAFAEPRPRIEVVDNLVFTPHGASWVEGRLIERYSACRPGLRMLAAPHNPAREIPEAYIVQSEHIDTFGDWISEYLSPLSHAGAIHAPVLLPQRLGGRGYVTRDAARTGLAFESVDAPVLVRRAHVVRQQRVIRYWRTEDADALRRLLKVSAVEPRPGSLLYLSRHGEVSEVADRTYPNEAIEAIVKARGGRVLRTACAKLDDYIAAAADAETILYDHGSAAYNMLYWHPRRAIEFVTDAWWMNAFLFFADAVGVKDYTIIRTDKPGFEERLNAALATPVADSKGT
ncbi:MAG: glycosyltransferase 61 family protein [Parvularculaceae bacterium]